MAGAIETYSGTIVQVSNDLHENKALRADVQLDIGDRSYFLSPKNARRLAKALKREARLIEGVRATEARRG